MLTFIIKRIKSPDFIATIYLILSLFNYKSTNFDLFQFSLYLLIYRKENYAKISNEQFTLELLRTFTHQISEEDVLAIRKMPSDYFAKKAMDLAETAWETNN
jgi:hypothetical protein